MTQSDSFFYEDDVKHCKDKALKIRLQTLIQSKGWSEPDFYTRLGISRQYWYFISWGIWGTNHDLRLKIAKLLETDTSIIWREKND